MKKAIALRRPVAIRLMVALAALLLSGCGAPKTYEDCILKYLDSQATKIAARQIMRACAAKFPPKIDLSEINAWEKEAGIVSPSEHFASKAE